MKPNEKLVIGVDFGSDSVRALVVDAETGETKGTGVSAYPRWKSGKYQHPERSIYRQHPLDYLESFETCVREAVAGLTEEERAKIVGIGVDTTGSTPVPVNREGVPLSLLPEYEENENAMFFLWKDHSAFQESEEVDKAFTTGAINYDRFQGKYSAEWYWAKILHAVREEPSLRENAYMWVEHCDWMVGILTGNTAPETMFHSACAAGHKAYWHSAWNGLPARDLLVSLDPYLGLVRDRYGKAPQPAAVFAGTITKEWAEKLGLPANVSVSGSSFDAHAGAVGAGVVERTLVSTIGTSAVDMFVAKAEDLEGKDIADFGGQAENSILPGYTGIETGQAAFGDIFAWFKRTMLWPVEQLVDTMKAEGMDPEEADRLYDVSEREMLMRLENGVAELRDDDFPISLDWFNGRRYPITDDSQRGVIANLTLGASAPSIYRSLVFAAVSGLACIVKGFEDAGIEFDRVRAVGGISKKSNFVMQLMADLLNKPVEILDSDQTCALGAAMYAAMGAGLFPNVNECAAHMSSKTVGIFKPDDRAAFYQAKYQEYLELAGRMR